MSAEANKAVIRSFVEAWNNKDLGRFDELMSQTCRRSGVDGPWFRGVVLRLDVALVAFPT